MQARKRSCQGRILITTSCRFASLTPRARERFPRSNSVATIGLPSDDSHHRAKLSSDSTVRSCRAGHTARDWASVLTLGRRSAGAAVTWSVYGAKRAQTLATCRKPRTLKPGGTRRIRNRSQPTATSVPLMVRRGSTVRVRQRALEKASKWPFFVASMWDACSTRASENCPQSLSPNLPRGAELGLYRGFAGHRAPPWKGGTPQSLLDD
jgi:hypothetical protein